LKKAFEGRPFDIFKRNFSKLRINCHRRSRPFANQVIAS